MCIKLIVVAATVIVAISVWVWRQWFVNDHVTPWLEHVESGIRLTSDSTNQLKRTDVFIFLAERTKFRVLKYNNKFYTQVSTFGVGWRTFERTQRTGLYATWASVKSVYDTADEASRVMDVAVSQIRDYIETSEYEDPARYRRVVVAWKDVTEKVYH